MSFCSHGEYCGADYSLIKNSQLKRYATDIAVAIESQLTSMLQLITFAATSLNSARHHVSELKLEQVSIVKEAES